MTLLFPYQCHEFTDYSEQPYRPYADRYADSEPSPLGFVHGLAPSFPPALDEQELRAALAQLWKEGSPDCTPRFMVINQGRVEEILDLLELVSAEIRSAPMEITPADRIAINRLMLKVSAMVDWVRGGWMVNPAS